MRVIAVELGSRPPILTKARRFAPEGMRVLADLLGRFDFADVATVSLDWSNVLGRQPDEIAIPILYVEVVKFHADAGNNKLAVEVRLDVEDLFGNDSITAQQLVEIVQQIRESMERAIALRVN